MKPSGGRESNHTFDPQTEKHFHHKKDQKVIFMLFTKEGSTKERWPLSCMTNIMPTSGLAQKSLVIVSNQAHKQSSLVVPLWSQLPRSILEVIFTYVNLSDLRSIASVCKRWNGILSNHESSEVRKSIL